MTPGHEMAIRAAVDELVAALLAAVTQVAPLDGAPDRLLDIQSASALLGIGRSRLYDEIGAGRLRSIKVGRRRLVPAKAIADFIAGDDASDGTAGGSHG
jgi:excisionase family DNA binding protein